MQGMSLKSLKKHKALIPLYFCVGLGGMGAFVFALRAALRNPDVSWGKRDGSLSNAEYENKQYKFYSPNVDYSKLESRAPKY